ncbi:MAG: proline/glycine betaine ABC transporter permease [Nocardioides sp.]|nr:proline/glycine betaine ABC transporter permease [Nocardioides sp.]
MSTTYAQTADSGVPRLPLGDWIDDGFDWLNDNFEAFFDALGSGIRSSVSGLTDLLVAPPALVLVALLALLAWAVGTWKIGLAAAVGLTLIIAMDQWDNAMATLSLVLVAAGAALVIGIPIGILAARSERVSRAVRPAMDLMQTMPAFVWLVPVVTLFGIGVAPGLVATVIFALPPAVRLTELGIRQVDAEVVEAGHAFGGTPRQILRGIQLPLAMPTVMAGVNQVIMLALSMAVIAGLVGGGGLGSEVVTSISRLNLGLGFEAGLSVVVLAIYLDRVTAALGRRRLGGKSKLRQLRDRSAARRAAATNSRDEPATGQEATKRGSNA